MQSQDEALVETEPAQPPYLGLQAFDVSDTDLFFGREQLTARLVDRLRDQSFLAVVGASGIGKSSIVHAGLIPALIRGEPLANGVLPPAGSKDWLIYLMTPTAHPLQALASSLTREAKSVTTTTTLTDDLAKDSHALRLYADTFSQSANLPDPSKLLIVVDQFEELFSLSRSEPERRAFIDNLLTACEAGLRSPARVVIVLRADFYHYCAQYEALREAVARYQEYVGPMTPVELREAIEHPAQVYGYEFEPGLVDLILRDIGNEPGALPLLSHALFTLWQRRRERTLTLAGYAEVGGVRGAIARTADTVYAQLSSPQQAIARRIFLRLTDLGEGSQDTRRRANRLELISADDDVSAVEAVLKLLADARLIITGQDSVEVAHEALIREWPRLREWLDENREKLRLRRRLSEAVQEWQTYSRDPSYLYRGARLVQVTDWLNARPGELNPSEREFIEASLAEQDQERLRRVRQVRIWGLVAAAMSFLGIIILFLIIYIQGIL